MTLSELMEELEEMMGSMHEMCRRPCEVVISDRYKEEIEKEYVTKNKPTKMLGIPFRWENLPPGMRFYVTTEGWEE